MRSSLKVLAIIWVTVFSFGCSSGDSQDKLDQGAADSKPKTDKPQVPPADSARPDQRPPDGKPAADQQQIADTTPLDQAIPVDQAPVQDMTAHLDTVADAPHHLEASLEASADAPAQGDLNPLDQTHIEASTPQDLSPDYPAGTLNCGEVYTCAQACTSADATCLPGCIAQGCGSATDTVIADFATCFYDLCFSECLTSFDAACRTCIAASCATEAGACTSHQC